MEFAQQSGYWPWAAIMTIVVAIILWATRTYYDQQDKRAGER